MKLRGGRAYRHLSAVLALACLVLAPSSVAAAASRNGATGTAGEATAAATAATPSGSSAPPTYYVALGDSVPVWDGDDSYAHLLENYYVSTIPGLTLEDMAISGATTTSMLKGPEYRTALRFLRQHVGAITLITIDIGGNDLVHCGTTSGLKQACVKKGLATVDRNLTKMLSGLKAAAPSVPIIGMNYFDPFLGDWLAGGSVRTLALGTLPIVASLNTELDSLYGGPSVTADVTDAFKTTNDTSLVDSPWGKVPIDVDRACSWLDITCHKGAAEGFGDDPNIPGQQTIAAVFEHTIGKLRAP
jgi:lysophospholipase L1-like esterase